MITVLVQRGKIIGKSNKPVEKVIEELIYDAKAHGFLAKTIKLSPTEYYFEDSSGFNVYVLQCDENVISCQDKCYEQPAEKFYDCITSCIEKHCK